jgi:nucleoside phosphorylase
VIGITEREEVDPEIDSYFEENLWYLLYSKSGSSIWKTRFSNFFEKIVEANIAPDSPKYDFDVFAIGPKPDVELTALKDLPLKWSNAVPVDDSQFFREAIFEIDGNQLRIGIGSPPRLGLVSATMYSSTIIEKLRPRILCMTGICAGIKGQCALGDIAFAEESWEWQAGKYVSTGESFRSEPYQLAVPPYVTSRMREMSADGQLLAKVHGDWRGEKPASAPSLHIGPIASGSAVVADQSMVDRIKGQHRKLLGIDMEIYGSYYSAAHASMPKPACFALKGVSDFADAEKGDKLQAYAAYVSARVLFEFLRRYAKDLIGFAGKA